MSQATGTDCFGNLADNINNNHKSNNTFQQKKEFYNPSDHQSNNFFQQKPVFDSKPNTQIGGGRLPTTEQQIGSKEVSKNLNKVVQKSEVERVNFDPKNRSAHELYKQDLKAESAQALRDKIFKIRKEELNDIKDLQDIGFKGKHPDAIKRNGVSGRIQANTDSQDTASYLYRKQVREFQNEIDIRGPSTTQRIKAPGSTLETVFEDGSRVLLRAESKTGVAKVEITDICRNTHEKITPQSNGGLK